LNADAVQGDITVSSTTQFDHLVVIGDVYVPRVWVDFLRFFLRWEDGEIAEWSKPYQAALLDPTSVLNHDLLIREVACLLIPDTVLNRQDLSGLDRISLWHRLVRAICGEGTTGDPTADWDWAAASERVREVLDAYGCSLADVNRQYRRFDIQGHLPAAW
jgi:hypothetical protein